MEMLAMCVMLGLIGWAIYFIAWPFIYLTKKILISKHCKYKEKEGTPGRDCIICRCSKICDRVEQNNVYWDYQFDTILHPEKANKLLNEILADAEMDSK